MRFSKINIVIGLVIGVFLLSLFLFYLDHTVMSWMRDFHQSRFPGKQLFDIVNGAVEFMGQGSTLTIIILVGYGIGKLFNKKLYELGKYSLIGFITSGLVTQILKHLIGRGRPKLTALLDPLVFIGPTFKGKYNSLPSGHAAVAFCIAYILSQFFPRYKVLFYLLAASVGFHRMEELAHFPSDILTGALVGLVVGKLTTMGIFHQYKEKVFLKFRPRIRSEMVKQRQESPLRNTDSGK